MTDFPLGDVLGTITGRLLGEMAGIYKVAEFMCGEPVWTHQLPRVCREISPVVLAQHPQLAPTIVEAEAVTADNWQEMLAGWRERFGDTIALTPMAADQHERVDPVSELVDLVGPDRVIVVRP